MKRTADQSPVISRRKWLESRDPRIVIVLFAALIASTFVIGSPPGLVFLLLYLLGVHRLAGGDLRRLGQAVTKLIFFLLIVIGINAVLVKGTPLQDPLFFLSKEGIARGVFYSLRVVVVYMTLLVVHDATSPESLAQGAAALFKPFSPSFSRSVALHGLLAMGFLPLFAGEVERVRTAQAFRGGGIQGGIVRRATGARALIVPLFVSAIHRSGQLAMAVELRNIRNTIGRVLVLGRPSRGDYLTALATLTAIVLAVFI